MGASNHSDPGRYHGSEKTPAGAHSVATDGNQPRRRGIRLDQPGRPRLNQQGRFQTPDGRTFLPLGGVYGNFLCVDWCGIDTADDRISPLSPFGMAGRVLEFQDATEQELHTWLGWVRDEGMNFLRIFGRGSMRPVQDPLDIGGRVNPVLIEKILHYLDLCCQYDIRVHLAAMSEPRESVYMKQQILTDRALIHSDGLEDLPAYRQSVLDPDAPRADYRRFFTDPDILACHMDYLDDLADRLAGHPALFCLEVYNEQQWGDRFFWDLQEQELEWTRHVVRRMKRNFPDAAVTVSLAGFGLAGQDPIRWATETNVDFFSPHAYQNISGTHRDADFGAIADAILQYTQSACPTMYGEIDPGHFYGQKDGRKLLIRDLTWFSLLNGCPGLGLWMSPGYGEFEIPARLAEQLDLASLAIKPADVRVDIHRHVEFFHQLESQPQAACRLPEDIWCPHRQADEQHRYCVKITSRELEEIYSLSAAALKTGLRYELVVGPGPDGDAVKIEDLTPSRISRMPLPFTPPDGYQLKYLSAADNSLHLVYLRHYTYLRIGSAAGRTRLAPRPVTLQSRLPNGGFHVDVWDLDERICGQAETDPDGRIRLGTTNHDFVLILRRR